MKKTFVLGGVAVFAVILVWRMHRMRPERSGPVTVAPVAAPRLSREAPPADVSVPVAPQSEQAPPENLPKIKNLEAQLAVLDAELRKVGYPERFQRRDLAEVEIAGVIDLLEKREKLHAQIIEMLIEADQVEFN